MSRDYPRPEHIRPTTRNRQRRERRAAERHGLTIEEYRRRLASPNRGRGRARRAQDDDR